MAALLFKEKIKMKPGSYRVPLVAGLVAIGRDELSKQVADKRIKLALSSSIIGAVVTRRDLAEIFIEALDTEFAKNAADEGVVDHYTEKLTDGTVIPVENSTSGTNNRYYAPGELYFNS